jgi:hypothetical protein
MKAVLIKDGKGPVENLYLGEEGTPEPEEGQVQVKVRLISDLTRRPVEQSSITDQSTYYPRR